MDTRRDISPVYRKPQVVDGNVIVQHGGRGASVVAYGVSSGRVVWKALDDMQAYVSPMLVTLAGRRQIVTITGSRAIGVSVDEGALLWSYPWATGTTPSTPPSRSCWGPGACDDAPRAEGPCFNPGSDASQVRP